MTDNLGLGSADTVQAVLNNLSTGSLDLFRQLPPAAREFMISSAGDLMEPDALKACYSVDYEEIPPSVETCLTDSDFAKSFGDNLFPAWLPVIHKACEFNSKVHEVIITGAQGNGKTFATVLMLYIKLARLMCLRSPAEFYNLQEGSKVSFGFYAMTKALLEDVGYYDFQNLIDRSPFFRDKYRRKPGGKEKMEWLDKRVQVITGSNELHAVGRNLFALAADELNTMSAMSGEEDKARKLVEECSTRLESRFLQKGGQIPGIAIYLSQTRTKTDYLELRINEAREKKREGVLTVRGPRWRFRTIGYHSNPKRGFKDGDPTFRVFIGTSAEDPRIIDKCVKVDGQWVAVPAESHNYAEKDVLKVPVVHYLKFKENIRVALRNIADVPSGSSEPFFVAQKPIIESFDKTLPVPFKTQTTPCYEGMSHKVQDVFDHLAITRNRNGILAPSRHPWSPRYISFDLSSSIDHTGMAMVHPFMVDVEPSDSDPIEGVGKDSYKAVEIDFYIAFTPGPNGEPLNYKAMRFFTKFLRRIGFNIRLISADKYMSHDHLQALRNVGFDTKYLSVDKKPSTAYKTLRNSFSQGIVRTPVPLSVRNGEDVDYVNFLLYQELIGLEWHVKSQKVDHRDKLPNGAKGSKDVADAVTAATQLCLMDDIVIRSNDASNAREANPYNAYLQQLENLT